MWLRCCSGYVCLMVMRGEERYQDGMFSNASLEQRVPDAVLRRLIPQFDALYAASGRLSIA